MKAAAISRVKISGAHDDEVLCKQSLSPLLHGRRMCFYFLHLLSVYARLLTVWLNQKASGVDHTQGVHAVLEVTRNTPPQVDTSTYRNKRIKSRARAVGKRRRRATLTPPVIQSQRNGESKPKPGEKKPDPKPEPKPDKKKSKPRREGDREPREPREPNAREMEYSLLM